MQQIKHINQRINTRRQSLPWPYAHIYAVICAVNCATNYVSRTRALHQRFEAALTAKCRGHRKTQH